MLNLTVGCKNTKAETIRVNLRRIIYIANDEKQYVFITDL